MGEFSPLQRAAFFLWKLGASLPAKALVLGLFVPITCALGLGMGTQSSPRTIGYLVASPMLAGLVTYAWALTRQKPWVFSWFGFGWRWILLSYVFLSGAMSSAGRQSPNEKIDPREIAFSLPTICFDGANLEEGTPSHAVGRFVRSDDWRQIEFIARELAPVVEENLARIRDVYRESPSGVGFRQIHTRSGMEDPLGPRRIPMIALRELLPSIPYQALWTEDMVGRKACVVEGFSSRTKLGHELYGSAPQGIVRELCLVDPRGLLAFLGGNPGPLDLGEDGPILLDFARKHDLILVDWCAAAVLTD